MFFSVFSVVKSILGLSGLGAAAQVAISIEVNAD
jgi:hypothetical protein